MENKSTKKQEAHEEKIGVIPVSQIEGSDADADNSGTASIGNQQAETAKSDADTDEQTAKK
ncbi:hypothetical protein [Pedobacter rhodius]|uniref:Uncharacterized protein n=1 Tax=Pedobacter rhodius TaxID=3004098 RepID=A0ABT4KUA9_9SPHI|nr:hypothetical protein [Pedobacter sp. SJ11]MCZ4222531.1 hypothetical protein [Pedobacter sp. SJ11]